jgi:two-component system nitrogen regulation sensor histidine kinase NtrY
MTLRTRLFVLVGTAVAVTVILVTWTVSASARRAFAAVDAQRAAALVAQFRREFDTEGKQIAIRLDRIAGADAVTRTAVDVSRSKADYASYVNEAAALAAAQGLDFLDVVADDGRIVSSAQWPARFGYRHPWALQSDASENAAAAGAFLQTVELPRELALGLVAVRSVKAGDRRLYLAGGRKLDEHFLQSLVLPAGMRALLYRNVEPEVSRQQLIDASGQVAQAAQLEPLIARVRQSGQEATERIDWPEGPEAITAIPLTGRNATVLGVLLVGSSGRELAALVNRIRWSGIAFGALGIVFGFMISYVVASRVTRPVEQLADAARAVAGGNWHVKLDGLHASGEVDDLARAFETMTSQLVDQRERLVQAERVAAWRELARRLAHELKNPLFPLRITLDNLRRARPLPAPEFDEVFDESLTTMATGLANLNAVVGRFSDFAKMPAPDFSTVAPNDIVRQCVQLFRAQLDAPERPSITLVLELDESAGLIRADAEQLGRAVQNLLLNAIDAMPAGGQLTVRTRRMEYAVRIDVADTGEGLTEEERQRLFTPYYTTKQHGTGLGLAIVQSVVTDHGGKISVESEPGRGTTFHVELPV